MKTVFTNRILGFVLATLAIAIGSVYSCQTERKLESKVANLETALYGTDATVVGHDAAVVGYLTQFYDLEGEVRGRYGAGAGFQVTNGHQVYDPYTIFVELANSAATQTIAANSCANVDLSDHFVSGEVSPYWGSALILYDGIDANTNCDGGTCSAFLTSILPADYHGGQLCQVGGAVCAGIDGGGIDSKLLSFPSGNATAYGGTEQLVWNSSSQTVGLQVCCGSLPCRVAGRLSAQRGIPVSDGGGVVIVDAGGDASDASSDASDSGADSGTDSGSDSGTDGGTDSGGGGTRTVSAVCPYKVLPSGSPITITGTGFQSGDVPVISGSNCTSTTVVSATKITCTTPALTQTASGATPGDVVVAGSATSAASKIFVEPSSTYYEFNPCVANTTIATGVSALTDISGAYTASQATGASQPALSTAYFGGQYALLMTSGQKLVNTTIPQIAAAPYSVCTTIEGSSFGSPSDVFLGTGSTTQPLVGIYGSGYVWFTNSAGSYAIQAGPSTSYESFAGNMLCWIVDGSSGAFFVDGTSQTVTTPSGTGSFGAGVTLGYSFAGAMADFWVTSNHVSSTDRVDHQWGEHYFEGTSYP
jgi:uncharacterized membrane protein YgcG